MFEGVSLSFKFEALKPNIPNLFIIGVAKAGTTALADLLSQHPGIYFSYIKEPNYFSYQLIENEGLYYKKPGINNKEEYLKLFESKSEEILGEASVSYFNYPEVAKEIKKFNPKAKAILLLRNPIERAMSHYLMDRRLGFVDCSLDEIVKDPHKFPKHYKQYIEQSLYSKKIELYKSIFKEDLLVLEWNNRIETNLDTIVKFLEIQNFKFLPLKSNESLEASNIFLRKLYKNRVLRKILSDILNTLRLAGFVKKLAFKKQDSNIGEDLNNKLKELFKSDCEKTEAITSIRLM